MLFWDCEIKLLLYSLIITSDPTSAVSSFPWGEGRTDTWLLPRQYLSNIGEVYSGGAILYLVYYNTDGPCQYPGIDQLCFCNFFPSRYSRTWIVAGHKLREGHGLGFLNYSSFSPVSRPLHKIRFSFIYKKDSQIKGFDCTVCIKAVKKSSPSPPRTHKQKAVWRMRRRIIPGPISSPPFPSPIAPLPTDQSCLKRMSKYRREREREREKEKRDCEASAAVSDVDNAALFLHHPSLPHYKEGKREEEEEDLPPKKLCPHSSGGTSRADKEEVRQGGRVVSSSKATRSYFSSINVDICSCYHYTTKLKVLTTLSLTHSFPFFFSHP